MQRVYSPEILDSDECPREEAEKSLQDLSRINRWFGGVATTRHLIERVASAAGQKRFSVLEVAAGGWGDAPCPALAVGRARRRRGGKKRVFGSSKLRRDSARCRELPPFNCRKKA